jgi:hypothetical protein
MKKVIGKAMLISTLTTSCWVNQCSFETNSQVKAASVQQIKLTQKTNLYNAPNAKNPVGTLNPQTVTVIKKGSNGWYQIKTYKGNKWINQSTPQAQQSITYINQKYKFSLTLPAYWNGAYVVKETKFNGDTWINFCYKKGNKVYDDERMFWIIVSNRTKEEIMKNNADSEGAIQSIYLGTRGEYSFEYGDGNLFGGDTTLYNDKRFLSFVNNDSPKVAKTFKFIK